MADPVNGAEEELVDYEEASCDPGFLAVQLVTLLAKR